MFSFIVNEEQSGDEIIILNVTLKFVSDNFNISFTCENYKYPIIIDDTSGYYDNYPRNGSVNFKWDKNYITFYLGIFDDGDDTNLTITIPNTPDIQVSLNNVIKMWKNII